MLRFTDDAPTLAKSILQYQNVTPPLNLATVSVRHEIKGLVFRKGYKLVVLDNIFSLVSGIDTNSDSDWAPINDWLVELRSKGVALIVVHHVGKGGDQLGTNSRVFNVDNLFL